MLYQPSQKILEKYAKVLVNFALNNGKGVKPKETIFLQVPESAKPLLIELRNAVLKAGAYPITEYLPTDYSKDFYKYANADQLSFFPEKYLKGKVEQMNHVVSIIAETDPYELTGIDPQKIMTRNKTMKPYINWRDEKEYKGGLTWTIALYGTAAMAKEAGLSLKQYWEQIIKACYLDKADPVLEWKKIFKELSRVLNKLNSLEIETLHVVAKDTDLQIGLGKDHKWVAGSGRNIPSFEVFTSPDWRVTEGKIAFNQPLYKFGNKIEGIQLEFKKGKVVGAKAKKGQKYLVEMIKTENADKVGEFSLTDGRLSRITKFMADTLFDENMGGKFGNTHLALGRSYKECYPGDVTKVSEKQWRSMGYNNSVVHTDIISTTDRTVTATLANKKEIVIYKNGKFVI